MLSLRRFGVPVQTEWFYAHALINAQSTMGDSHKRKHLLFSRRVCWYVIEISLCMCVCVISREICANVCDLSLCVSLSLCLFVCETVCMFVCVFQWIHIHTHPCVCVSAMICYLLTVECWSFRSLWDMCCVAGLSWIVGFLVRQHHHRGVLMIYR